ncbi:MAG: CpsB/CapC family capsule biosynthesis tyrosine phosphatase, partial [Clostridia bacterium]|nr:CpsB/CapC family capsule biosynthesis tyrosine phosphatase [Clostridia bacterium]
MHIHIVPNVDDGAANLAMSLEMLKMAYNQGVRNIFCTSHNVYDEEEI